MSNLENRIDIIKELFEFYSWQYVSFDEKNGRLSYESPLGLCRIDVYLTKMTVGLLRKGFQPKFLYRQNVGDIEQMILNNAKY